MRVILTDDVVGVGDIGQEIRVKAGFARNFLIPRGLAMESGSVNAREIEHKMRQIEAKKKRLKVAAEGLAEKVSSVSIELELRVGRGGKVFGSIGTRDIAEKINAQGLDIDRRRVLLTDPIKKIGSHTIRVKLHPEVTVEVPLTIKAISASKEEEDQEGAEALENIEKNSAADELEEEIEIPEEDSEDELIAD